MTKEGSAISGRSDIARPDAIGAALYGLVTLAVRPGPREISLTAASTLSTLDRTGPRRLTDLAVIEGVTQPSMSVLVTGLEQAGLAERRQDPADKRVVLVALTAGGADYIEARRRAGAREFAELIEELPDDQAAALAAAVPAMDRLRDLAGDRRAAAQHPPAERRSARGGEVPPAERRSARGGEVPPAERRSARGGEVPPAAMSSPRRSARRPGAAASRPPVPGTA